MINLNLGYWGGKKDERGRGEGSPSLHSILCKAKQFPDPLTVPVLNWAAEKFKSLAPGGLD